ncbi:MAG: PrsW family intramembrane metalloprotease [Anaerolineales bacterium]|nr:MAG: PrsW family intramembrane metalloprotease [Anaerolineales bacterium]
MQILLGIILSLLASGMATALYAWLVWWLDHYEKEPWWLLALVFLWGAVPAIVLALVVEFALDIPVSVLGEGLAYEIAGSSLVAPAVEEVAKGMAVFSVLLFVRQEMDNILDGIVYGAMAGLGFAFTENLFYMVGSLAEAGWGQWAAVLFMRAVLFGLNHAFFTGVTGGALGYARLSGNPLARVLVPFLGLGGAIIFHSIHNLGATLASVTCFSLAVSLLSDWAGILMLGLVIGLVWRQEMGWIQTQLEPEVGITLRREVYEQTASYPRRLNVQARALLRGDIRAWQLSRRLTQTATELAFKKHQLATLGGETGTRQLIENLRERLVSLQASKITLVRNNDYDLP